MSDNPSPPDDAAAGLRASDEDREQLVTELHDNAVAGRLSTDELEERLQATYAARTTAELDALRRDLPVSKQQSQRSDAERRSHLTRRLIQETGGALTLFVVCCAIWLASGASGSFWPVWVLIVVLLSAARTGWSLFGPAPDLDAVESHLDRQQRLDDRRQRHEERHRRRLDR
jgi:Domain of unknown function (DUF1707)